MCLWSLNPAVAFRSVSESVRSVILASGTLSPLGSFASEVRKLLLYGPSGVDSRRTIGIIELL